MREQHQRSAWHGVRRGAFVLVPLASILAAIALKPRPSIAPSFEPWHRDPELADPSAPAPLAPRAESLALATARSYTLPPLFVSVEADPISAPVATTAARTPLSSTSILLGVAMVLWFAAAYLWQYRIGGQVWPTFRGTYAAGPYLWTICAAVACCAWSSTTRPDHESNAVPLAFIVGAFSVAVLLLTGIVAGMGHSPYARSPFWLLTNGFYIGAPLVAFEFSRAYIIRVLGNRVMLAVALTAILASVLGFSYRRLLNWDGAQPEIIFFSSQFLPDLASNLLASFLVYLGGPFAGIVYRGVIEIYEWYSPILPDLPWLTVAFLGVATPAVGLWVLEGLSGQSEREMRDEGVRLRPPSTAWVLTATASLAILWFTFGFFGVKPSFIPSHSMEPVIDSGSIVVTRDIDPDDVQVGDIVLYQRGRAHVLHRVIEKRPDGTFIFKGDNNNTPDPEAVQPEQIEGRLMFGVPYAGWVPIWASRAIQAVIRQ